ncbi:hypothetical protein ACFLZL_03830 [Thermodesulfobacteriota bacterium]
MKRKRCISLLAIFVAVSVFACFLMPPSANGALIYKNYVVRQDRGREILCEPYVVKKNDWVYKLFRESGEISQKDYPEFLRIFKRLNPQVNNLDIIRPGERILIPLRKVQKDSMPGQSSGIVSVPFLNISNIPELLKSNASEYEVKKGDYVSKLVAGVYGGYGSQTYSEGLKLFQFLNPDITNLNLIYPGQRLQIPSLALRDQPWYHYLFVGAGDADSVRDIEGLTLPPKPLPESAPLIKKKKEDAGNPFVLAASILDGKYLNRGIYYFPRQGEEDAELDLSLHPLIELQNGSRVLFSKDEDMDKLDMNALQAFWKEISVASVSPDANVERVLDAVIEANEKIVSKEKLSFSDQGIDVEVKARWVLDKANRNDNVSRYLCVTFVDSERAFTPEPIINYLEQRNITIWDIERKTGQNFEAKQLEAMKALPVVSAGKIHNVYAPNRRLLFEKAFAAMGYQYKKNVSIPLASSDVRKTVVSNLLSNDTGKEVVIDFATLESGAVQAIEKAGYDIFQPEEEKKITHAIEDILQKMDEKYTVNPVFFAAKRAAYHNTRITIPGFLVEKEKEIRSLITLEALHDDLITFFKMKGFDLILIQER